MATLVETAQRMQDLYEQNYTPNDKFLDLDDFKYQIAITYSGLLNAMYQQERKENKRMDGFSNIEIPAAWLLSEPLVIEYKEAEKKHFVTLPHPVYSFDWDNAANALQGVHSLGTQCVYRKISLNERKFRQVIPPISAILFYLNTPTEIIFWGATTGAKVETQFVPQIVGSDDNCMLSDNIIGTIMDITMDRMFKARDGKFVQKADNQNPNVIPQQQVDPALGK